MILDNASNLRSPKLIDQGRGGIRIKHYPGGGCLDWIRRFIAHYGKRQPRELWSLRC
jgi:hypothetical protein